MTFESKYLIRWGIPGWVLIFWVFFTIAILKDTNLLDSDMTKGFTLLILLAAIGVPAGYLLHQLYFGVVWVLNKNKWFEFISTKIGDDKIKHLEWGQNSNEDYYQLEYVWHSTLLNQPEDKRTYIEGRYRHLLGTIHSLGSLFMSSIASFVLSIIAGFLVADGENWLFFWIGLIIQILIFLSVMVNYKYFSDNLIALQIKFIRDYYKKENVAPPTPTPTA